MREDISRILPQKRYATKDGNGYAMQVSLKAAHSKYFENPTKAVSLGKFAALRKRNISFREYCCCVYCINVRYKMLSLTKAMADPEKMKSTNEMDIPNIVLCPKRDGQQFHDPACINGICKDCNSHMRSLSEYYKSVPEEKTLTWCRWVYEKNDMGKSKRVVVTKKGTKQECLKEFLEHDILKPAQGTNIFQHLHTAI
ncbi:hypothetical protein MAR_038551 [Mya arenaria]|uniref:Uncharacterized protein n=1 Tax=Mya arenaria TaxID=6604 RepID=A0ABY7FUZ7_MYAAR|nr:hypothetical protein MAR_038551 [Mya arenaria]